MFDNRVYDLRFYKYMKKIAEGKIISNKWMILLAKKTLNDIERSKNDDFEYYVDVDKANAIEEFIKELKYTEGLKKGEPIILAEFQDNIVVQSFAWRCKSDSSITRFREIIVFIPRKNGKSYICSLLGLVAMMTEVNAEVVNGASKLSQAQILVNMAIKLVKTNKDLAEFFDIYKRHIEFDGSIFKAISSNALSQDGQNISTCLIDESMVVERALKDSMTSGFLMRKSYQTFMISTEYDVPHEDNWFVEMIDYGKKVLEGILEDDRILPIIYCLDNEKEVHNKKLWIKANPILDEVPSTPIENDYKKASINPATMKNLLIKQFNVAQAAMEDNAYLRMDKWKECGVDKIDFTNKKVHIGIDLSLTTDISAVCMMFKENGIYYMKSVGFIPRESLIGRREKFDYELSSTRNEIFIRDGLIVDYSFIEEYVRNIKDEHNCEVVSIGFDPYNATEMMLSLSNDYEVIEIKQNYTNLSSPTKTFREQVYLGNVVYEKSMLFDWCVSNAITISDKSENIMLDKSKSKYRIDLIVATIFAFKSASGYIEDFNEDAFGVI